MAFDNPPTVSQWYKNLEKGYEFRVASIDEDEGTVEVQYIDGDSEEIDLDSWYDMDLETIEPPEDWVGGDGEDDEEDDDLDYDDEEEEDDWDEDSDDDDFDDDGR
jgi:hypothetical protein